MERAGFEQAHAEDRAVRGGRFQGLVHEPEAAITLEQVLEPDARRVVPGGEAEDREERPRHVPRQLEIGRGEPSRLGLQEAVKYPPTALVRLEQGNIGDHVDRVLVGHDLPLFPEAKLLGRPGQVGAAAGPHGLSEHAPNTGADRMIGGQGFLAGQRSSSRCKRLG